MLHRGNVVRQKAQRTDLGRVRVGLFRLRHQNHCAEGGGIASHVLAELEECKGSSWLSHSPEERRAARGHHHTRRRGTLDKP